ncbi:MAG: hypothetical protein NWF05_08970 [Candidatus Bathyarchaeota archaeon]|nr:hypothetical protein [Candidatus Bathyarchaeota archaeon]
MSDGTGLVKNKEELQESLCGSNNYQQNIPYTSYLSNYQRSKTHEKQNTNPKPPDRGILF